MDPLTRIKRIADYQFGRGVGDVLFPDDVEIEYSKGTGRIRYVYLKGKRLATLRPTDGLFSLSIYGAERITKSGFTAKCLVTVDADAAKFVAAGGDVFAGYVIRADDEIRPKDEVIVINEEGEVVAVGRAVLSGSEMAVFRVGVAVKVRRGRIEES